MVSGRKVSNPLALAVMALLYERPMHPSEMASRAPEEAGQGVYAVRGRAHLSRRAASLRGAVAPRGADPTARGGGWGDEIPPGSRDGGWRVPGLSRRERARAGAEGGRARVGPRARPGDRCQKAGGSARVGVLPPGARGGR